ncbi:MAG: hypothetical protein PHI64_16905 [Zoogloea sp.]|uniref:hypothetical protein n=1 Tax=Zoogloea sp. TaxID=49181 RepID=UPI0026302E58|nr:hypothetical protein [Zoogloea sp.]MDD2990623.1 hypothetical protein [Zoogloea sp.]
MATDVQGIISSAQDTAKELADQAGDLTRKAQLAFDTRYEIGPVNLTLALTDVDFNLGAVPQYQGSAFVEPESPGAAPSLREVPELILPALPVNTAQKPVIRTPQTPSQLAQFNKQAPTLSGISVPAAPAALQNLALLTPPTLTDITVPGAPIVQIPEFDAVRPDTSLQEPGNLEAQFRQDFRDQAGSMARVLEGELDAYLAKINPQFHSQMAAIEDRLARYLAGGTGFTPAVENAIWNRANDKIDGEFRRARDAAYDDAARRGFTLPTGALHSTLMQSRQAAADASARAAMDIAIKQAELEQANLQFAVTQSASLRQVALQATQSWAGNLVQINGQALEFAKGVLQAAIELYEIRAKTVQIRVQLYQAEAEVYQHRLKAALAVYDAYQAHIEGLKAQVGVDAARVQAFQAQADGYAALANAYKAVIDGLATRAQIEKLKVDAFGAEVNAFQAQVQAKTAEWQGFRAQLEGETIRIDAYGKEVQAYGQEVDAYKAQVQAQSTAIQAASTANEAAARTYQAAVSAYSALVQGRSSVVEAEIKSFESTLRGWTAGVQAKESEARVKIANNQANAQATISAYQQNSHIVLANMDMNYKRMNDMSRVGVAGAEVFGKMASSALSGMNALAASVENQTV